MRKQIKKDLKICNKEIDIILLNFNCGLDTTYDCSHPILQSLTLKDESISRNCNQVTQQSKFDDLEYDDEDIDNDEDEHEDEYEYEFDECEDDEDEEECEDKSNLDYFNKCNRKIKSCLSDYNCILESSYDYSCVVLKDAYGNSKKV